MHKPDHTTAVPAMPAISASGGNEGWFSEGNPSGGQAATVLTGDWANDLLQNLDELRIRSGVAAWTKGYEGDIADAIERLISFAATGSVIGRVEWVSASQIRLARTLEGKLRLDVNGRIVQSAVDLAFDITTDLESPQVEAASTWYYAYVELNAGSLVPHLSATAPVRDPASGKVGYHPTNTSWRYIGAVYNDASSNFVKFKHMRKGEIHLAMVTTGSEFRLTAAPGAAFASQAAGGFFPVTARMFRFQVVMTPGTTGDPAFYDVAFDPEAGTPTEIGIRIEEDTYVVSGAQNQENNPGLHWGHCHEGAFWHRVTGGGLTGVNPFILYRMGYFDPFGA